MCVILNCITVNSSERTDCSKRIVLGWSGSSGSSYEDIQKYVGTYIESSLPKRNRLPIYENFGNDSVTSYLYHKKGFGWRINDRVTEDSKDIPAIILRKCMSKCPEKCENKGKWMYRNSKNLPVFDGHRRLHWKIEERDVSNLEILTTDKSVILSILATSTRDIAPITTHKNVYIESKRSNGINIDSLPAPEKVNKASIGNAFILIIVSIVGLIATCALVGVFLVFRTIKKNRTSIYHDYQATPTSIDLVKASDHTIASNRQISTAILEEGIRKNAKHTEELGKRQRSVSVQDYHERYKPFNHSYSFPSPVTQPPKMTSNSNGLIFNQSDFSEQKSSRAHINHKESVICQSNFKEDATVLYLNENAHLAHFPANDYSIKVEMKSDEDMYNNNDSRCTPHDVKDVNNSNDNIIFLKNHRTNTSCIPKIRNTADESVTNGRKRLISLQTSFEDEPSESSRCSSSECVVTEVTKLGNGKIKKTVYRYNIERPQEKERLYSI